MTVKLLTEHHLEFLSLKGGCRGSSKSTHVKMPHCWKSHALAHIEKVQKWASFAPDFSTVKIHCTLYNSAVELQMSITKHFKNELISCFINGM